MWRIRNVFFGSTDQHFPLQVLPTYSFPFVTVNVLQSTERPPGSLSGGVHGRTSDVSFQVRELAHPSRVLEKLMQLIVRLAKAGLIHGDFNEFNLMIDDDERITVIGELLVYVVLGRGSLSGVPDRSRTRPGRPRTN